MGRFIYDWLLSASPRQPLAVEERLVETMLVRKGSLFFGSISIIALAAYAHIVTDSIWPTIWVCIEVFLLVVRLRLIEQGETQKHEKPRFIYYCLLVAGATWSFVTGIGSALCVATGDVTLSIMAGMNVAGIFGAIASRNAAIPRYALMVLLFVAVPFFVGLFFSPIPHAGVLCALLPVWTIGMYVVLLQNYHLNVRAIQAELTNRFLATNDMLTGLPNRVALDDKLSVLCDRLQLDSSNQEYRFTLLCLDLDGFKAVNDEWGHAAGDILLQHVSEAIQKVLRAEDSVFRIGGDEFVVLVPNCSSDVFKELVKRIIGAVAYSFDLGGGQLAQVSASVGSAKAPENGISPEKLLDAADKALYSAKSAGKGVHRESLY